MAMDQFLAEYYGTAQPAQDDTEKTAQVELFVKLAAAEGIDLNQLSDAQVEKLYADTFSKTASEDEGEKDEKKEEAREEHEEKKAAAEKFAEADQMGRIMAHAYVQEMRKIAESTGGLDKEAFSVGDSARRLKDKVVAGGKRVGELATGSKAKELHAKATKHRKAIGQNAKFRDKSMDKAYGHAEGESLGHLKGMRGAARAESSKVRNARIAAGVGGGLLLAGGAGAAMHKKSSAIDELAAEIAVEKAASAGWNLEEACERVGYLVEQGASEEGTKVAQAADVDQAIEIRASELLEQAGYPVDWS